MSCTLFFELLPWLVEPGATLASTVQMPWLSGGHHVELGTEDGRLLILPIDVAERFELVAARVGNTIVLDGPIPGRCFVAEAVGCLKVLTVPPWAMVTVEMRNVSSEPQRFSGRLFARVVRSRTPRE